MARRNDVKKRRGYGEGRLFQRGGRPVDSPLEKSLCGGRNRKRRFDLNPKEAVANEQTQG